MPRDEGEERERERESERESERERMRRQREEIWPTMIFVYSVWKKDNKVTN